MFTAGFIHNCPNWKQFRCPSTDNNKLWYIHTMEYNIDFKNNKAAPRYIKWEKSKIQSAVCSILPFLYL